MVIGVRSFGLADYDGEPTATVAVTAVVVLWHPPCPFEVTVAALEAVEMFDDRGLPLYSVEIRVRNRTSAGIEFASGSGCEIKIAGRWLSSAGSWSPHKMAGAGTVGRPASDGRLTVLLAADVEACRFRLKYRKIGRGSLRFGLRDPWAAIEAPRDP